jgi:hypothetical protein
MNVYLVPVGASHYELYTEEASSDAEPIDEGDGRSWLSRQKHAFRRALAEAEIERERRERGEPATGNRIARYVIGKIAEFVAELRLLWHLRGVEAATLVHPDDLQMSLALRLAREQFGIDVRRHWRWCLADAGIAAIVGPLHYFVPGPNVIANYIVFRAIGHFRAARGAQRGRDRIRWRTAASALLAQIRPALGLDPGARRARLDAIAESLELSKLALFVERVSKGRRS